ncbi:ATP-binding protein [Pseudoduganella namucuonensis]|uniref:Histidine kinase-, DNA gyrase B-, and HSP90-like ATPase n=1 Tax=Pseudoduganella namucuonensis TaxID=1035707 RepID=A0A1I7M0J2_9BURK|nr:ATP-binding protein [Pseudoduganella namucuonensis]SFV15435.1 Histidine kinase-, DNA gyrase B-, and HSP90-like ATPase [Pseudoduganella namucuonensis]
MKIEKNIGVSENSSSGDAHSHAIETIGELTSTIKVELSTRFLEHFSEQLYSSPQKAFEELISNSWDAGADFVDVRISGDLGSSNATMCIFDNGVSMDEAGLRELWHIAFSPKRDHPIQHGRSVVGKFGIGKLATYVLASKLTYICKATDGVIRRVTMDYSSIDQQKTETQESLISDLNLDIYSATDEDVRLALKGVDAGDIIQDLISYGLRDNTHYKRVNEEFGGEPSQLQRTHSGTWTLVVLSGIKPTGRALKIHVLRRMLESALPFGSEMLIRINGRDLTSSKAEATVIKEWEIGPNLGIDYIELDDNNNLEESADVVLSAKTKKKSSKQNGKRIAISSGTVPVPYVEIPGIGRVTGTARLFEEQISSGKSEERGASNGFHVNVLGRVVNQNDPSFGEGNLSHAAWARFRMAVRADGLNTLLTTSREQFKEREETKIFRAFLRRIFNLVRSYYDSDRNLDISQGGDVLLKSLGVLSLKPLLNQVSETLRTKAAIPELFDESGIEDREEQRKKWRASTSENIKNAVTEVRYFRTNDDSFVKFRISDSTIIINKEHPFVIEHSHSKAEKELIRTVGMVNLLSDMYALDIGVEPDLLKDVRSYRDKLLRFRALQRRQSGTSIARILLKTQHDSDNSKRMEAAVSDALRYLGFDVQDLAKPGEPEGIASAYPTPTNSNPSAENKQPPLYSFSFDAKSSKHEVAATGNIKLDGVVEHRERFKADYALVIAPGFSEGALSTRCQQQRVTPMKAQDLGRLLEYTVTHGAIAVTKMQEIFTLYHPDEVSKWVEQLEKYLKQNRQLTINIFLNALESLKGQIPDVLNASTIAHTIRRDLDAFSVKAEDVVTLVKGLAVLIPDLVQISDSEISINASAKRIADAVKVQLEQLHDDHTD